VKITTLSCPNCSANIQTNEGAKEHICQYCGTQIVLNNQENQAVNQEYEAKMALVQTMEQSYFKLGFNCVNYGGKTGYDAVIAYYADAERAGGVTRADYYLPLSRFMVFGRLKAFEEGKMRLVSRQQFINGYVIIAENAIKYSKPEDKAALEEEKNRNIRLLETELIKYPEQQAINRIGCYIATAVYHSYDCPQVWVLRRFRDQRLSKSPLGRLMIKIYYAVSPNIVRISGSTYLLEKLVKPLLNRLVYRLQLQGIENTPYEDVKN